MKQIIITIGLAVIIMLVSLIIISVDSKSARQEELNRAVSAAVKQTVKDSQVENKKSISSDKEMIAQFVHILSTSLSCKGDITIEVMGVDYKEGMLDVLVTQKFEYLNGKSDRITIRKSAIYE